MPKKGKKKLKEIDYASDEMFLKDRSMIYIEHTLECPIFTIKADEFLKYLQTEIPQRQFAMIRNHFGKVEPRPGSFEIEFSQNARTSKHSLWSGLDKGPPRRDKFPKFEVLMPEIQKVLKKFYTDVKTIQADDMDNTEAAPAVELEAAKKCKNICI